MASFLEKDNSGKTFYSMCLEVLQKLQSIGKIGEEIRRKWVDKIGGKMGKFCRPSRRC